MWGRGEEERWVAASLALRRTGTRDTSSDIDCLPQDGSGSLDRNEVRRLVEMVGARLTEKELDAAMAELDPSGDGQVQFSEFKQYWVRLPPPHPTR